MTFVLQVPESEELIDAVPKRRLFSDPFCFAVTKEAIYLPTLKKGFVLREPFETTRVPLSSIRGVALYPARAAMARIFLYSLFAFVPAALVVTDLLKDGRLPLFRLFLAVGYMYSLVCMILGSRGRYCLRVDIWPQPLTFEPQVESTISAKAKAAALEVQMRFLDACRRTGISAIETAQPPTAKARDERWHGRQRIRAGAANPGGRADGNRKQRGSCTLTF